MRNIILSSAACIICSLVSFTGLYAQYTLSASDKFKLLDADDNFQQEYYAEALRKYKEIRNNSPEHAGINYKCGKASVMMNLPEDGYTYLTKALALDSLVDKEVYYWLGRAQHKIAMLDEALVSFQRFKATLKGNAANTHIVNEHIFQIENAKKIMANPVNVVIKNLGAAINSEYKESNPSITADGSMLIFTTCRPENKGGQIDPNYGIYYQDVWYSDLDSVTGKWKDAEPIFGDINTDLHDACTSISPDGSIIFVYRSVRGGDIYYSRKKKNGDFRTPEPLGGKANSSYFETGACISANKKNIYFISERINKGLGNGDIWMAKKTGTFEYGDAENLGNVVNTVDDENSVFLHPDGKTLYFSSNSMNSIGGYDIFKTELVDGKWTKPVNLGYPINTLGDEMHFVVSTDGTKGYFTSKREDTMGDFDIYEVDLTNYKVPNADGSVDQGSATFSGPPIGIIRGKLLDKNDAEPLEGKITIKDTQGNKIGETESNEAGEYFTTVEAGKNYILEIKVKNYEAVSETIELALKEGSTSVVVKVFLLTED